MSKLIKGTHHIALKYESVEVFEKSMHFFKDVLGLELVRTWGSGDELGAMLSTGNSLLEMFSFGSVSTETGSVNHFALATDDVDACIEAAKAEGLEILKGPKDIVIGSVPPFPARIGFCRGWGGEEIEFFCEK